MIAQMKFPTWEEAAAAVFSGSSTEESTEESSDIWAAPAAINSSSEEGSDIWATPAATTSTTTWTPHSELEHATTTPSQPKKNKVGYPQQPLNSH